MKKEYFKPTFVVVNIQTSRFLLTGSYERFQDDLDEDDYWIDDEDDIV